MPTSLKLLLGRVVHDYLDRSISATEGTFREETHAVLCVCVSSLQLVFFCAGRSV